MAKTPEALRLEKLEQLARANPAVEGLRQLAGYFEVMAAAHLGREEPFVSAAYAHAHDMVHATLQDLGVERCQ